MHVVLPPTVPTGFATAIETKLVELITVSFEDWFGLMEQFVQDHGHANVPKILYRNGRRQILHLGRMGGAAAYRLQHRRPAMKLLPERAERLENLDGWVWDAQAAKWEEGFRRLRPYVDAHGNALVPQPYKDEEDGYKVGCG